MTEQLQQLRGKSLSNEQLGNAVEALSLTVACSQHFVNQNALGMHNLVVCFLWNSLSVLYFSLGCRIWMNANIEHHI